jgi:diguanylate cyclase (GGDEF)-like protein/PAS domain S-box-containing protein
MSTRKEQVTKPSDPLARRLLAAVNNARDGIAILDPNGYFEYVNEAHAGLYGYARAVEMHGHHWSALYGLDERARIETTALPALARDGHWFGPARGRRLDGTEFDQEVSLTALPDGGMVCVVRDSSERESLKRRLDTAEADYQAIFEHAAEGIYRCTVEGRFFHANPALVALLGYESEQELLAADIDIATELYADDNARAEVIDRLEKYDAVRNFVCEIYRPGIGERIWVNENAHRITDADGNTLYFEGTFEDISELARRERQLAYSEQRFHDVLQAAGEFVWETDAQRRLEFVSERVTASLGWTPEALVGTDLVDLATADWAETLAGWLPRDVDTAPPPLQGGEARFHHPDGHDVWLRLSAVSRHDETGVFIGWRGTGLEITSRKAAQERASYLADHDELTGLPVRRVFTARLQESLARADRHDTLTAVLFIDLDRFKQINDINGHQIGDALLVAVGQRIHAEIRRTDLLARLSGDEFGVILDDVKRTSQITPLIQRLLERFRTPFEVGERRLQVSASIGVYVATDDSESANAVLNYADTAMYQAKQTGGDSFYFFDPELDAAARWRIEMETALREALGQNQLRLVFQPQIALDTPRVVAAEALTRWHHPELGEVSPTELIPVAEQTGLILPIGDWILDELCRQLATRAAWSNIRVFANVSAIQLSQSEFPATVAAALQRHGLDSERLGLEITESTLLQCTPAGIDRLHQLSELGIALALDDFGTGYSSLTYLRDFPVSHLKIDMSFVQRSTTSERDRSIVVATARLAAELGLETVAEGVETGEQVAAMVEAGCQLAQGFYYASPLAPAEFDRFLQVPLAHRE